MQIGAVKDKGGKKGRDDKGGKGGNGKGTLMQAERQRTPRGRQKRTRTRLSGNVTVRAIAEPDSDISAQYLRSSVELLYRPFWKDARSGVYWSESVHLQKKTKSNHNS